MSETNRQDRLRGYVQRYLPRVLLKLIPIQIKFLFDEEHLVQVVPSGRRGRKSIIAKKKIMYHALSKPNTNYFHAAPTRSQAKKIFWKDLKNQYKLFTKEVSETDLCITLKNGSEIWVIGLDEPQRIEGYRWHGCHLDEFGDMHKEVFDEHVLMALADTKGFIIVTGTAEPKHHYFNLCCYAAGGTLPVLKPGGVFAENPRDKKYCFYQWSARDVLDEETIASMEMRMDEDTFNQEVDGNFILGKGRVYKNFSDKNVDSSIKYNKDELVGIGLDFNWKPFCGVMFHKRNDCICQFDEIHLEQADTEDLIRFLYDYFDLWKMDKAEIRARFVIYCDASGQQHSTKNAKKTDVDMLQDAGFMVIVGKTNPAIRDRINVLNSLICSIRGLIRYKVHPKCTHTITDMKFAQRGEDGLPDKKQEKQGMLHTTDGLGYAAFKLFPIYGGGVYEV
jgi:hypothetical protein